MPSSYAMILMKRRSTKNTQPAHRIHCKGASDFIATSEGATIHHGHPSFWNVYTMPDCPDDI